MFDQSHYTHGNALIQLFHRWGKPMSVKSHDCVIHLGQKSNKVFLLLSGGFVCQNYNPETSVFRTINFHLENFHPLMTVLDSYFRDVESTCQLKSIKRSEVLALPKKKILKALENNKELQNSYFQEVTYALTTINIFHTNLITLRLSLIHI